LFVEKSSISQTHHHLNSIIATMSDLTSLANKNAELEARIQQLEAKLSSMELRVTDTSTATTTANSSKTTKSYPSEHIHVVERGFDEIYDLLFFLLTSFGNRSFLRLSIVEKIGSSRVVAVIGAGIVGRSWAIVFSRAGLKKRQCLMFV
jgi:hypothetical protein